MRRWRKRPIRSVELLLDVMRANMPCGVFQYSDDLDSIPFVGTIEDEDNVGLAYDVIRYVKVGSEAGRLLDEAFLACIEGDEELFFALPIRLGPAPHMWVLAEAPFAPGMIDDESGTDDRSIEFPCENG